jgi:hypothetical protein
VLNRIIPVAGVAGLCAVVPVEIVYAPVTVTLPPVAAVVLSGYVKPLVPLIEKVILVPYAV